MQVDQIKAVIGLYEKFDWKLRRVLLVEKTKIRLKDASSELFGEATIVDSEIDAMWFSRRSGSDSEAWELRRLSETPFALFEVFSDDDEEEIREETRHELEQRLILDK